MTRDELITNNLPLVQRVVSSMLHHSGAYRVDREELAADGVVGLIQAADRFDPARGQVFSTFAWPRIAGAIKDGLRRNDPLTRSARHAVQAGEQPNARHVPVTERTRVAEAPDSHAALDVRRAVARLDPTSRQLLHRSYWRDQPLRVPNYSNAWASMCHTKALRRLKADLAGYEEVA